MGVAATVDGHRITESEVSEFITAKAQPIAEGGQDRNSVTMISPRAFVVQTLIDLRLLAKLLAATPGGVPSEGRIADDTSRGLNGSPPTKFAESAGVHGYTAAFDRQWIRSRVLGSLFANEVQRGLDVRALIRKLHFPVSVNPRYGTWDKASFNLRSQPGAGLPGFLELQPTPTPTAPATGESVQPVR